MQKEEEEARKSTQFRARPYDPARYSTPPLLTPESSRASTNGGPRGSHRRDALEGRFTPQATRQERQNVARAAREVRHAFYAAMLAALSCLLR